MLNCSCSTIANVGQGTQGEPASSRLDSVKAATRPGLSEPDIKADIAADEVLVDFCIILINIGTGERQARRIVSSLLDKGVVVPETTRAPLRLAFAAALASRWMPGLFPERRS